MERVSNLINSMEAPSFKGGISPNDGATLTKLLPLKVVPKEAATKRSNWLKFHQLWGQLSDKTIEALASSLQLFKMESGTEIYQQETQPTGLYLLQWGKIEIYRHSLVGKIHIAYRKTGDIFGYEPLMGTQEIATHTTSAQVVTTSKIWFLSREDWNILSSKYPEIHKVINCFFAQNLRDFTGKISAEQARSKGLQAYIQPVSTKESILGKSKASQKLRQQIERANLDLKPIILQGNAGSGKTFIAGLIHSLSQLKARPFAKIDCEQLPQEHSGSVITDLIFGKENSQIGVIELLEKGTLLIDNAHLLNKSDRDRLSSYFKTGYLTRNANCEQNWAPTPVKSSVRLILASPEKISFSGIETHQIKLFNLSQRKEDIPEFTIYFLEKFCRERGRKTLQLDQASLRRLISYEYPSNIAELEDILKRAVNTTPQTESVIPERLLWSVESPKNAFRLDLLNLQPWLRQFLLSQWWTKRLGILMMAIFIPLVIIGFIGPQIASNNLIINFLWAWWWPFSLVLLPLAGRLWCSICPFMITGDWLQKLSLGIFPRQLLSWPNRWLNKWGAWVVWAGFVAIYVWEKLWDLPHTPYLSAWLLVLITLGAVISSLIYERRLWCRYLCPIGGMNGMFAKLSIVEVRSTPQLCGSQCSSFGCHQGSTATQPNFADALFNEGQATEGCPISSHPAQLSDNRNCVMCMSCLKACPNRSVQLNLRLPAADLWEKHQGSRAEVALMLLLFGGVFMHYSHRLLSWFGWQEIPLDSQHLIIAVPIIVLLLNIPFAATYLTHKFACMLDRQMPDYLSVIYAYLPMTLAANLAYYFPSAVTEAGKILPIIARTFGYSGTGLPTFSGSIDVAGFLQGVTLISIFFFSLYPLFKITKRSLVSNLPHLFLMLGFIIAFFNLML